MRLNSFAFLRPFWLLALLAGAAAPASASARPDSAKQASPHQRSGAGQAQPRPAIWLLADEDTRIFLFGTIHILPRGFKWRSPEIDRIMAEADELVVETYSPPGKEDFPGARTATFLPAPKPILLRVPPEKRSALKAAIRESRIPTAYYDRLQTWAASMALGMAQLMGSYGTEDRDEVPGVEDVMEEIFRAAGKPIRSVEDPGTVVASLNALPEPVQRDLLLDSIESPGEAKVRSYSDSVGDDRLWAQGDIEGLAAYLSKDFPPALFDALLRRRNQAWSGWLAARLERPGTILFAVGAGHLAGRESVQRMLARRGLNVTRIN